jgi:glycosyltransferase involved in cell wall biosynthesis
VTLLRLYERLHADLVHHIGLKPSLYGGIAARVTRVPRVVSTLTGLGVLFSSDSRRSRGLRAVVEAGLRFGFAAPRHHATLQHEADRERLLSRGISSPERTHVVPGSGVDLGSFLPTPEVPGVPVVLMVSRLLRQKGVEEFAHAARTLRRRGVAARFVLVGEPDPGHPSALPVSTVEAWGHAGDVEWLRWRCDVPSLLARSHIVCLPTSYGEGIPRVLIEAAACGRAVVATNLPGCREVVKDRETGLLVPVGDRRALVAAISRLLDDPVLRRGMGRRGHELVSCRFSSRQTIEANLQLYEDLFASGHRHGDA